MGKYLKAVVLLILAAVPVLAVLILTFGGEDAAEPDYNGYNTVDNSDVRDIEYGDVETDIPYPDDSQVTILTMGGLWFPEVVRSEVERFNFENDNYQIKLSSFGAYVHFDPSTGVNFIDHDAIERKGVDIIIDNIETWFTKADLYTFIDADLQLSREDFFSNVLAALEAPNGTLPFITHAFIIETMISTLDVAEQIGALTFTNVLRQQNQPTKPSFANFGLTWDFIIDRALHLSGDYFLDLENSKANFYNEEFLSVLGVAAQPHGLDLALIGMLSVLGTEWERFQRGDALMNQFWISNPDQLRTYQAILGDIVAVGIPTVEGGVHVIGPQMRIGINAESPHQEVAWSFVRRFLLPTFNEGNVKNALPLRIDLFEARINELMTPDIHDGEERPQERDWPGARTPLHPVPLLIYAMTEDEAAEIRKLVESAVPVVHIDRRVHKIVREETAIFIETNRSAEETARIIQDRVQEFFDTKRQ